jgi:hypothetical protein
MISPGAVLGGKQEQKRRKEEIENRN